MQKREDSSLSMILEVARSLEDSSSTAQVLTRPNHYLWNYALIGMLFGAGFPVLGTLLDAAVRLGSVAPAALFNVQSQQPLLWIIDTAPIWLGIFAGAAGAHQDRLAATLQVLSRERVRLAEAVTQSAELLEELETGNKALRESNAELIAARKLKSEFLANVSHELRTPLNAIIGFSKIVLRKTGDLLPAKQLRNLQHIRDSGHALLAIVNDLLDIERIEAGMLSVTNSQFDLDDLCAEVIDTLRPRAEAKQLTLHHATPKTGFQVNLDRDRLRQILANLVVNAIKYSDSGATSLSVRMDGPDLAITVTDEGIGIGPEDLENIFLAFRQVDGSATRRQGGVGLGLHLVRRLCLMMDGRIDVSSEVGKGSEFTVYFPTACVIAGAEPTPVRPNTPAPEGAPSPIVLCIDDEAQALEIVADELSQAGFEVHCATSGAQGIELAGQLQPAVIITDMMMPELDGWGVLSAIKSNPDTAAIPVVVLSNKPTEPGAAEAGAMAWFCKPLDGDAFSRTFEAIRRATSPSPILVVEDDDATRSMVVQQLEERGLPCLAVSTGAAAIAQLNTSFPAAVILDLGLDGIDGHAVLRHLRSLDGGQAVPVVIYTARDLDAGQRLELNAAQVRTVGKGDADGVAQLIAFIRSTVMLPRAP